MGSGLDIPSPCLSLGLVIGHLQGCPSLWSQPIVTPRSLGWQEWPRPLSRRTLDPPAGPTSPCRATGQGTLWSPWWILGRDRATATAVLPEALSASAAGTTPVPQPALGAWDLLMSAVSPSLVEGQQGLSSLGKLCGGTTWPSIEPRTHRQTGPAAERGSGQPPAVGKPLLFPDGVGKQVHACLWASAFSSCLVSGSPGHAPRF